MTEREREKDHWRQTGELLATRVTHEKKELPRLFKHRHGSQCLDIERCHMRHSKSANELNTHQPIFLMHILYLLKD
jgi:hypothetical protein